MLSGQHTWSISLAKGECRKSLFNLQRSRCCHLGRRLLPQCQIQASVHEGWIQTATQPVVWTCSSNVIISCLSWSQRRQTMFEGSRKVEKRSSGSADWPAQKHGRNKRKSILLILENRTAILNRTTTVSESCWYLGQLFCYKGLSLYGSAWGWACCQKGGVETDRSISNLRYRDIFK